MGLNGLLHFIVKYTLFLLNLVFTILGLVLAVAAIVIFLKFKDSLQQTSTGYEQIFQSLSIIVVVLGIITFIVAFCGCWGSVLEKKGLLVLYAIFMSLLITPMIYGAVQYNSNKDFFQSISREGLNASLASKKTDMTLYAVEFLLECCGTDGPDSYDSRSASKGLLPPGILPPTCCTKYVANFDQILPMYQKYMNILKSENSFSDDDICRKDKSDSAKVGCFKVVHDFVDYYGEIIKKTNYAIIAFEGLELIGAIYLCSSISQRRKKFNKRY